MMDKRIRRLKSKAMRLYRKYHKIRDEFSCGSALASHISPRLTKIKDDFNAVMVELEQLDPAAKGIRIT